MQIPENQTRVGRNVKASFIVSCLILFGVVTVVQSQAVPEIESVKITDSKGLAFTWKSLPDHGYRIEYRDSATGGDWKTVPGGEEIIASDLEASHTLRAIDDGWISELASRFYRVVQLPFEPQFHIFQDPDSDFRTTLIRDIDGDIVQVDELDDSLRWAANRKTYLKFSFPVSNEVFLSPSQHFWIRFGTEEGRPRAYITENFTGTLCDVSVDEFDTMFIFPTSVEVPKN